jgi:hypothetical protein
VAPANQRLLASLPSYWFLGLFQQLNGSMEPAFVPLVRRAWIGLAVVCAGVATTILLSYFRTLRRIVEEPDILPGSHRLPWPRAANSVEDAVLMFSLRTLLRSRQHRMILSFYLGIGFGVTLILLRPSLGNGVETAISLLAASVVMMCAAAAAIRTVFSMPIALRANWLFRVSALHPVARYLKAVRRAFLALAVAPLWICFAALLFSLWPWRVAMAHLILLALLGSMLTDLFTHGFHKIPFTCSYRPGKANLQFALWGLFVLLPFTLIAAVFEWRSLQSSRGQFLVGTALLVPALLLRWWTVRSAELVDAMQFEEIEESEIVSLALAPDLVSLRRPSDQTV